MVREAAMMTKLRHPNIVKVSLYQRTFTVHMYKCSRLVFYLSNLQFMNALTMCCSFLASGSPTTYLEQTGMFVFISFSYCL